MSLTIESPTFTSTARVSVHRSSAPFGWYNDPAGSGMLRWWDGSTWSDQLEYPQIRMNDTRPARRAAHAAVGIHS